MEEQYDLFNYEEEAKKAHTHLNGMYYEQSTGLFVSYVLGRRFWEGTGEEFTKEWRTKTMKERAIS